MKVLLVEPDTILAKTYTTALETAGHHVVRVVSAQTAVRAADTSTPDVIVLSLGIARHNGAEFLYEFKSYPEWQPVPVVLLVPRLAFDLGDPVALRDQLGVQAVLVRSQTTLVQLCDAVLAAGEQGAP
ncbi:hypothetical protein IPL85_03580 [Candidatus Saccharibacteria bacterium]|nr:MAG: hypothetical protein IPL85_03580 [Candidatus Saccharibacteria bacterium]